MGKHENLNSPEKSLQQKEPNECNSVAQENQQNPIPKHNLGATNDLARSSSKRRESMNIRNCNDCNDHNENNNKQTTSHTNDNNRKKKRRNKAKSKSNPRTKPGGNVNGLEENEIASRDDKEDKLKIKNISKIDSHTTDITMRTLTYNESDEMQKKDQELDHVPHLRDKNFMLNTPVGKDQLQVSNISPRKQTILRYKKSDDRINERPLINEAKENLKNKRKISKTPESQRSKIDESTLSTQTDLDMDEKMSLFKYKFSKILVFDEQLDDTKIDIEKLSSGRLLGHGEFEIFQLHNGDVTYLSCGPSFVYPLLPKLKILRISFNQFILPLANPERYWKIYVNSEEKNIIELLEKTLEKTVKYRNLFLGINQLHSTNNSDTHGQGNSKEDNKATKNNGLTKLQNLHKSDVSEAISNFNAGSQNYEELHPDNALDYQFPVIFNEIPESPPSAPLSPHNESISNVNLLTPTKNPHLLPGWSLKKKASEQSITSAIASLDVNKDKEPLSSNTHTKRDNLPNIFGSDKSTPLLAINQKMHQPKPKRYNNLSNNHSNALQDKTTSVHKIVDNKSDSSMDSLLDEYEENIFTTKSLNFNSRPASRPMSVTSSFSRPQINYTRGLYFHGPIERDPDELANSHYNENFEDQIFPATSLSEYNKARNGGNNGSLAKSRRSSRSELYTSESNWMEPNTTAIESGHNGVPKSRNSIYSHGRHINTDVKQIYRSFTQRNLSEYNNDVKSNTDSRSVKSHTSKVQPTFNPVKMRSPTMETLHRKGSYANSVISGRTGYESMSKYNSISGLPIPHSTSTRRYLDEQKLENYKVKLNSSEVYKIISESRSNKNLHAIVNGPRDIKSQDTKRKPQATGGFASRLFGW